MRRRRPTEHTVNHERWLVSYADFITLLFAFFVVMYSVSQVNESQYRVLSNTLTEAFNLPEYSREPIQIGRRARSNPINLVEFEELLQQSQRDTRHEAEEQWQRERFHDIGRRIEDALGGLIDQQLVSVRGTESWLEIELQSSLLFASGEADLEPDAMLLLGEVAAIVRHEPYSLRVEGFTDALPISTARFPSNWELSAARAAAVVRLFAEEGVEPQRMAATGYGEFRPVADNGTAEGRARNRRVLLKLSRHLPEEAAALAPAVALPDAGVAPAAPGPSTPAAQPVPVPQPGAAARLRAQALADELEAARGRAQAAPSEPPELLPGVRAVPLEGGGVLFTRDREADVE